MVMVDTPLLGPDSSKDRWIAASRLLRILVQIDDSVVNFRVVVC